MKYNLAWIMRRAWSFRREKGFTLATSLRLAWREAKGEKDYTFHCHRGSWLENARASITAYLMKLAHQLHDIHDEHKYSILRDCLLAPVDALGIVVLDGKAVGLCKYAVRTHDRREKTHEKHYHFGL